MPIFEMKEGVSLEVPDSILTPQIQKMLEKGWYEVEEYMAIKAHLLKSDIVLELGSGVGYLAVISAKVVGAKNVTTVEANQALLPIIKSNLSSNEVAGVTLINGVVVSISNSLTESFYIPEAFWAATQRKSTLPHYKKIEVPALIFDELLSNVNPTVLIVDVEGAEEDFFCSPLPKNLRLIILEIHPEHYSSEATRDIFERLFKHGFFYQTQGSKGAVLVFRR